MSSNKNNTTNSAEKKSGMIFSKENYVLTIISLAIITLGFILMTGSTGDIMDFRRITLAPIVVTIGFILGIYAIFFKKK